ncbi:aminotransferase class V-fold PLP-dependent enzyme [Candidatus Woesearchaeota archaeon]|nr:aminotransferase class V-fold PLP-dependent enzyme [Candidatus Woesearchaeota archaeon]
MMEIITKLQKLINHPHIAVTERGNSAIEAAFKTIPESKTLLIPEEGGWLSYEKLPKRLNIPFSKVKCDNAKINLNDLKEQVKNAGMFIYQNPGGYFAEQPMKEIYQICKEHGCLVVLDISGSIGTELCDGDYADITVCSFGEWKLVEAKGGGCISAKDKTTFDLLKFEELDEEEQLFAIEQHLDLLPKRIKFLQEKRQQVIKDLHDFQIVHPNDLGFVVVIKYSTDEEKEKIIQYCETNNLPHRPCPRYIRLQSKAISIEIKQLTE